MGVVRNYGKHRRWTAKEEELLSRCSEKYPDSVTAKKLGRTTSAVKAKRIAMGISSFTNQTDKLTLKQVADLVGLDKTNIGKVWVRHGLSIQKQRHYRLVKEEDLVLFMRQHPEFWKASKCDYYFFCRYKWFRERLEREKAGADEVSRYQNYKYWTSREISRMQMLKRKGLTHRQIGAELGRSKRAVDKMVMRTKERNDKERIWS